MPVTRQDVTDALKLLEEIAQESREIDVTLGLPIDGDFAPGPRLHLKNAEHARVIKEKWDELECLFSSMATKAANTRRTWETKR